jgi:hypothetical protein
LFPVSIIFLALVFFSAVFIDVDHYLFHLKRTGILSLKKAYIWQISLGINHKPIMHIFHTLEFHLFVLILALFIPIFLPILIGMLFHSCLDIIEMIYNKRFTNREYSLIYYLISDKRKYL